MKDLLQELESFSDKAYKIFNTKIVNTKQKVIGVRVPQLRKIAKRIIKYENFIEFVEADKKGIYELVLLEGLVVAGNKKAFCEKIYMYESYFQKVDSWAHIDIVMQKDKKLNHKEALKIVKKWLKSNEEFMIRAGLVMLLANFVSDEFLETIFTLSQRISNESYYVHMANAWLIAECMAKYPKQTKEFFKDNKLDRKTHNKAIQKSLESFRVAKEDKEYIGALRR